MPRPRDKTATAVKRRSLLTYRHAQDSSARMCCQMQARHEPMHLLIEVVVFRRADSAVRIPEPDTASRPWTVKWRSTLGLGFSLQPGDVHDGDLAAFHLDVALDTEPCEIARHH